MLLADASQLTTPRDVVCPKPDRCSKTAKKEVDNPSIYMFLFRTEHSCSMLKVFKCRMRNQEISFHQVLNYVSHTVWKSWKILFMKSFKLQRFDMSDKNQLQSCFLCWWQRFEEKRDKTTMRSVNFWWQTLRHTKILTKKHEHYIRRHIACYNNAVFSKNKLFFFAWL